MKKLINFYQKGDNSVERYESVWNFIKVKKSSVIALLNDFIYLYRDI